MREAGLHRERRHLLPVRREHARADRRAVGGARADLFVNLPDGKQPPNTRVVAVPRGHGRARGRCPTTTRRPRTSTSPTGRSQFFVLHDQPGARRRPDHRPEARHRPVQPADGRLQLHRRRPRGVRRRHRRRSPSAAPTTASRPPARPCAGISSTDAEQFSGSFAIVLDGELVSQPIINFVDNPTGIDGRTGAQISGVTAQEAQDLAEVLKIGALPIKLALISQSTVSATLGQQALDQGLKAGLVGLALVLCVPDLLLPLPRRDRRRSG